MNELLLCALRRIGRAATAADVADGATGLAMDAGWSRQQYLAASNVKRVAAALRAMEGRGLVRRDGEQRVDGVDRPLWAPVDGFDAKAPVPAPPARAQNPLEDLSQSQVLTVFDVQDTFAQELFREREAHLARVREIDAVIQRARRTLATVGLPAREDDEA